MIACDTSVLVAAFARWHDGHDIAVAAVSRANAMIDHVAVETFSVLTRMPPPRRVPPNLVTAFLGHHFPQARPRLPSPGSADVLEVAHRSGISGGAVYDLMIGLAAAQAGASLLTFDGRAAATYRSADIEHELLG